MSRPKIIEYTWPPVMPNRSPKLKELMTGNPECADTTLYRSMENYGINPRQKHYITVEIIEAIKKANEGAGITFAKYEPKGEIRI